MQLTSGKFTNRPGNLSQFTSPRRHTSAASSSGTRTAAAFLSLHTGAVGPATLESRSEFVEEITITENEVSVRIPAAFWD